MSKESLAKFWKRIESDAKLQRAFDGLFKRSGGRPVATGTTVVDFAAKHGFKFTTEELRAHLAATGGDAEISEAELEAIAGSVDKPGPLLIKGSMVNINLRSLRSVEEGDGIVVF